jgi:hypothetical protein
MDLRTRITASLNDVRGRGQRLVQLNVELLKAELKAKGEKYGVAVAMFFMAGLLALYMLGFALATIAVVLHLVLPLWLSLLIVTVLLALLIVLLIFIARDRLLRAGSPVPEKAIAEARASMAAAKAQLKRSGGGPGQTSPGPAADGPSGPALEEGRRL